MTDGAGDKLHWNGACGIGGTGTIRLLEMFFAAEGNATRAAIHSGQMHLVPPRSGQIRYDRRPPEHVPAPQSDSNWGVVADSPSRASRPSRSTSPPGRARENKISGSGASLRPRMRDRHIAKSSSRSIPVRVCNLSGGTDPSLLPMEGAPIRRPNRDHTITQARRDSRRTAGGR